MTQVVNFKSIPEYYQKEERGIKNNTVRVWERFDKRFKLLDDFIYGAIDDLEIKITNTETGESFTRRIRDVTEFEVAGKPLYIITWYNSLNHEKEDLKILLSILEVEDER
jgi:hypothetical protein